MAKSIMITGASSGIGRAVALEMGRRGYSVGLTARRGDMLETVKEEILSENPDATVAVQALDVTTYDEVPKALGNMADRLGGLDIVLANAGIGLGEKVGRGAFEKSKRTVETNLLGAMATIDAAAAFFLASGSGHIVAISSVAAFRGMARNAAYCASKAGLSAYMDAVRVEMLKKPIFVTVLYPGFIDTPLNEMISSRPFLITAQKGAKVIADLIEKRVKHATVPVFPWNVLGRFLKILPDALIAKM